MIVRTNIKNVLHVLRIFVLLVLNRSIAALNKTMTHASYSSQALPLDLQMPHALQHGPMPSLIGGGDAIAMKCVICDTQEFFNFFRHAYHCVFQPSFSCCHNRSPLQLPS
jgi:hypothetical protein